MKEVYYLPSASFFLKFLFAYSVNFYLKAECLRFSCCYKLADHLGKTLEELC